MASSTTTPPTISIEEIDSTSTTHQSYTVTFFDSKITTLLTQTSSIVTTWISNITQTLTQNPNQTLIVGLDVEWRPNFHRNVDNSVSILQLSTNHDCLIFQLMYADSIPKTLIDFLNNPRVRFVGVGIEEDVEKLLVDYDLRVENWVDLRGLAVEKLGVKELKGSGLKELCKRVLGKEVAKPRRVTMSRWDAEFLTYAQIQYACLDAYLSWKIGERLMRWGQSEGSSS